VPRDAIVQADGTALQLAHDHHTFDGIVFDSGYGSGDGIEGGGSNAELFDVEVRRTSGDCIDLRTSSDISIEGASIHHCVAVFDPDNNPDAHGVTGDSVFRLTIRDSEIFMLTGDAIQMSPARDPWDDLLVERTTMWTAPIDETVNGWTRGDPIGENAFDSKVGPDLDGSGANPNATFVDVSAHGWRGSITNQGAFNVKEDVDFVLDRATIHDSELAFRLRAPAVIRVQNTVVFDVDGAFRLEDGLAGLRVFNLTVGGEIAAEVVDEAGGAAQGPEFRNVLVLSDALPALIPGGSNMAVGADVFVDAANHDYHLLMDASPVDAGEAIAEVDVDRDAVPRPVGDAYDVGAFEWTDMPPPSTTTDDGGSDDGVDGTAGSADASASDDGPSSDSAGATGTAGTNGSGGDEGGQDDDSGCGCTGGAHLRGAPVALLVVFATRRRRRHPS
jgi:hypothetical protein